MVMNSEAKMNNKGTTLVEVMISIGLIAIVMVFLFNLLIDLKSEDSLSTKNNDEALNRATIIRIINTDFINKGLKQLTFCDNKDCTSTYLYFNFYFNDGTSKKMQVFEDHLIYDDEGWKLSSGKYNLGALDYCYKNPEGTKEYYLKINIPVVHKTSTNRNFDLDIVNMGEIDNINIPNSILYNSKNYTCS